MNLLVLDLDGTITKSDSLVGFSLFMLINKGNIRFALLFPLVILMKLKFIDNVKFKKMYSWLILKNLNAKFLNDCAVEYVKTSRFINAINSDVLDFIRKQENTENLILSANFDFIAKNVAVSLAINHCVSVKLGQVKGIYTSNFIGIIPYGKGKVEAYLHYIKNKNYAKTIGIGDSRSDLFLLKQLDEGYMVKYDAKNNSTSFIKVSE